MNKPGYDEFVSKLATNMLTQDGREVAELLGRMGIALNYLGDSLWEREDGELLGGEEEMLDFIESFLQGFSGKELSNIYRDYFCGIAEYDANLEAFFLN